MELELWVSAYQIEVQDLDTLLKHQQYYPKGLFTNICVLRFRHQAYENGNRWQKWENTSNLLFWGVKNKRPYFLLEPLPRFVQCCHQQCLWEPKQLRIEALVGVDYPIVKSLKYEYFNPQLNAYIRRFLTRMGTAPVSIACWMRGVGFSERSLRNLTDVSKKVSTRERKDLGPRHFRSSS